MYNAYRIMGQQYEDRPIDIADADQVVTREMLAVVLDRCGLLWSGPVRRQTVRTHPIKVKVRRYRR